MDNEKPVNLHLFIFLNISQFRSRPMGIIESVFQSIWKLILVFLTCIGITYMLFQELFRRQPNLATTLHAGLSFEDVQRGDVHNALRRAMDEEFALSVLCFGCVYFIKQTFALPGSALLNILAGVLLPLHIAFPLVSLLTMVRKKKGQRIKNLDITLI
jgi:hypothetical protein